MQNVQSSLVGQRDVRIEKLKKLKKMGINPYPAQSKKDVRNSEILANYDKYEGKTIYVTGRLMSLRKHGQIVFGHLQDDSAKIQLYIKSEILNSKTVNNEIGWNDLELIDIGDFLQVGGEVTRTNTGEISILVKSIILLSKAIRPLPEKWRGIQKIDERFRRRYLDMTMNPEVRELFKRRSLFWKAMREFLIMNGFYEVNIPVLEHTTGGADAKPFITHFDALDTDLYLRISHELPLKRLLGGGFEKVFDLGPRFRNEGFSDEHLPEHIAMEFYWAYADKEMGMKLTEEMFRYVVKAVYGKTKFTIRGFEIDFDKKWEEIDFASEMKKRFDIDVFNDSVEKLAERLHKEDPKQEIVKNRSRIVDALWKIHRESISGPAFIINIPKFFSPLAKADDKNPLITQRAQPFIAGSEMASSWAELNDPQDQLDRFIEQQKLRDAGDEEAQMIDIDFVEMLEYGMPPAFGLGLSERVFWFLENVTAREGVPFPPMRWELDQNTKKIYKPILKYIDGYSESQNKTQDFSKKIVIVLDDKLSGWQLTNTIGHISAFIGNKIKAEDFVSVSKFDILNEQINANSQYPIVVLTAKQNQLKNLYNDVKEKDLINLLYIKEMIDFTDDDKLQKSIENKELSQLDILGLGIFGQKDVLESLTKKFSLYK